MTMNWAVRWVLAALLPIVLADNCHNIDVRHGNAIRRVASDGESFWTLSSESLLPSLLAHPAASWRDHRVRVLTFDGLNIFMHGGDDEASPLNVSAHFEVVALPEDQVVAHLRSEVYSTSDGQLLTLVFDEFPTGSSDVVDANILHVKFSDYISPAPLGPWSQFLVETSKENQLDLYPCVNVALHLNTFTYTTILQAAAAVTGATGAVNATNMNNDAGTEGEDVLLQVDAEGKITAAEAVAFSIPGLQDILKVFLKLLMPPVFDPVLEKLNDHLEHLLAETVAKDIVSTTPKDVMAMLEPDLRRNLTNLLVDSVTAAVTNDLCVKLTATLTPPLTERLVTLLETDLRQRLTTHLQQLVTLRLDTTIPTMLHRSLLTTLTETLSLSLPPTITAGLSTLLLNHNDPHLRRFPSVVQLTEECDKCQSDVNQPDKSVCWACREDALEFNTLQHAHCTYARCPCPYITLLEIVSCYRIVVCSRIRVLLPILCKILHKSSRGH
jgi:hypothetical protein